MKKEAFMSIVRSKFDKLESAEEQVFNAIGEALEEAFSKDSIAREKKVNDLAKQIGEVADGESIAEIVRNINSAVADLEKRSKVGGLSQDDKYLLRKKMDEKKDEITRALSDKSCAQSFALEFNAKRAASAGITTSNIMTTTAGVLTSQNYFEDMDIAVIRYPENFILDGISSRQVSKVPSTVTRVFQVPAGDGAPGVTAEGGLKPKVDYTFKKVRFDREKVTAHMTVTEETTMDFEQLMLDIISMFERDVLREWQKQVYTKVDTFATPYSTTKIDGTISVPNVNNVILAVKTQAQAKDFNPDVVFLNTQDVATMMALQDKNGMQMFVPQEYLFHGMRPFVTNYTAPGTILCGESSTIREQHGSFILRSGTINEQLIHNESTIVGEVFYVLQTPEIYKNAWVKGDIDVIKGKLAKVA